MAPPRRRGANRASAAARHQWKPGDLVLAKVKGFPAWPATVSEPEKWGYSLDWRKVLVYFFGTNQIAFCNHADVEAFTEEKKKSLLIKSQGKGADFVRAVDEIVETYEKSMKQKQDDEFNSGDNDAISNAGNSQGYRGKSCVKRPIQSPPLVHSSWSKAPYASLDRSDSCNAVDSPAAVMEIDDPHDVDTVSEEPIESTAVANQLNQQTLANNSSRKKSRSKLLQGCVIHKRAKSSRRSRSSSLVESSKHQKLVIPSPNADMTVSDVVPNLSAEESTRRCLNASPSNLSLYSIAFGSNDVSRDILYETSAKESETSSFYGNNTLEPIYKLENPEIGAKCHEKGVTMDRFKSNSIVLKKKRKPTRKRIMHDKESGFGLDKGASLEEGLRVSVTNSTDASEKANKLDIVDGDGHLPLVKRARARMGKPSIEEKKLDEFVDTEKKYSKELTKKHSEVGLTSFSSDENHTTDSTTLGVKDAAASSSPTNNHARFAENDTCLPWKAKKYHLRGIFMDGEATLPPTKRLHRALEAMSANAAEAGDANVEPQKTIDKQHGCEASPKKAFQMPVALATPPSEEAVEVFPGDKPGVMVGSPKHEDCKEVFAKPGGMVGSPKHEECKEMFAEAKKYVDVKEWNDSPVMALEIESCGMVLQPSYVHKDQENFTSCQSDAKKMCISETAEVNKVSLETSKEHCGVGFKRVATDSPTDKSDREEQTRPFILQRPDLVSNGKANWAFSHAKKGSELPLSISSGGFVASTIGANAVISLKSQSDENTEDMYDVSEGVNHSLTSKYVDVGPYSTSMKVLIAAAQAKRHFSRTASLFDSFSTDQVVSDAVPSPYLIHRQDSREQLSPPKPLMRSHLHDGRSPDANLQPKNSVHTLDMDEEGRFSSILIHGPKSLGKLSDSVEANAARKSFEAMLGTLSRTKESIGRATRLAIDCAKFGIAGEVIELLLQYLESEQSLHRRVDLFFLVDSITQCSRGQKGGIGDIYSSAVQTVLPRLLSAAAPPGNAARENRRQCLKVLRLWLERKTLPESIVRRYMRELDSVNDLSFPNAFSRRPLRTERALNDPVREMEGMLVDEYGSNTSFQLPGFVMPCMIEDEEDGSAADEQHFEAVTPVRDSEIIDEPSMTPKFATEKHRHILEDVDGELEMEDVSPSCDAEISTTCHQHLPLPFGLPPLPGDVPPSPPPLPSSPPPQAPLPPPPQSMLSMDSNLYRCTNSMYSHWPQQQLGHQNINSMPLETAPHIVSGYSDPQIKMPTAVTSFSSASYGSLLGPHPMMLSGNTIQQIGATPLSNKAYHVQPPHSTISNQFSYVQVDPQQHAQSWVGCSSPSFTKKFQLMHDGHVRNSHADIDRMRHEQHQIDERGVFSRPNHSGYSSELTSIPNSGWSMPPTGLNYQHTVPAWRPPVENPIPGVTGAPNFWRPS